MAIASLIIAIIALIVVVIVDVVLHYQHNEMIADIRANTVNVNNLWEEIARIDDYDASILERCNNIEKNFLSSKELYKETFVDLNCRMDEVEKNYPANTKLAEEASKEVDGKEKLSK